ncbi:MAG TPA: AMP-binding protein, partial [Citricoccus sp.]
MTQVTSPRAAQEEPVYENYAVLWRRIAAACPGDAAVSDGVQTLGYGEFDRRAAAVAVSLRARGVGAGDRVAFCLHNTVEFLVGFFACLKLEAIPVSVNYRYRAREVEELLAVATPAVLVFSAASRASALEAVATLGSAGPRLLVEVAEPPGGTAVPGDHSARCPDAVVPFEALLDVETADRAELPDPGPGAQLYVFTGGTTGTPRAVVWEIGSLLQIQQTSIYPPVGLLVPTGLEEAVALATAPDRPRVVTMPLAPFIHATALFSAMNALALGGTVVIHPQPGLDAGAVAERIVRERVTRLIVAGDAVAVPILDALEPQVESGAGPGGLALGSVISSGMRFSEETKRRLHRLGEVAIVDILASTEGGPYAMAVSRGEGDLPARFRLAEEAVVLDEGHRQVQDEPGATGVLAFRGPLPR